MDDERRHRRFERGTDPARVLALSDGVFAIIITLLVLEIHVPELTGGQDLREALREVRPSFAASHISFVVVAASPMGRSRLPTPQVARGPSGRGGPPGPGSHRSPPKRANTPFEG